jgi:hypothetical protein
MAGSQLELRTVRIQVQSITAILTSRMCAYIFRTFEITAYQVRYIGCTTVCDATHG